ncbi:MAG: MFS transporter, partial [Sphaerobacter sp.]|nr:MFS transporter [Sphaerobacter sp.]
SRMLVLTLAILVLLGAASIIFTSTANARLQVLAPRELRGRVMSLYIFLFAGTAPLGSLTLGYLAEALSVPLAVGAMAALCALGLLLGLHYRAHRPAWDVQVSTPREVPEHSGHD